MGVRNKQWRRENARRRAERAHRQASRPWARDELGDHVARQRPPGERRIREALWAVAGIEHDRRGTDDDLEVLVTAAFDQVASVAEEQLLWLVGVAWQRGWQPSELVRHARRCDRTLGLVVAALIVVDHHRRIPSTVHPQWAAQVEALEADDVAAGAWLANLVERRTSVHSQRLDVVVSAMVLLAELGTLPTILPPPGGDPSTWSRCDTRGQADDPVLAKVRALLAQAESTTFEAEAETFTAKAQQLMARHAIDAAMVWSRTGRIHRPVTIRLQVDDPYANQKAHLLHVVAERSRCTAVSHPEFGLVAIVGFAVDVAATEMLYTSLLVQSHAAMLAEAASAPPGSHTRGRSFRTSFLFAYACRIDKRLAEINAAVEAETSAASSLMSSDLLPVLASRADAIDEEIAATFGTLLRSRVQRSYDALGWNRGVLAADRAELRPDLPAAGT
jgi:hypothetical protein